MFTHYRTQGFILKKVDSGEADRICTIYTKDFGKLELLAKAERKIQSKLRGGLELFYLSEIEFIQGKTHKTLTDAILINNFKNLRENLKTLSLAFKISEIFDISVKGQEPDEKLWQLLQEVFHKLNNYPLPVTGYQLLYYFFLWNILSLLGYQPELYHCSLCQRKLLPEIIYFGLKEGGLVCAPCQKKTKSGKSISPDTVKIIRILLKKDWSTLGKLKIADNSLNSLKVISNYYLSGILRQIE